MNLRGSGFGKIVLILEMIKSKISWSEVPQLDTLGVHWRSSDFRILGL